MHAAVHTSDQCLWYAHRSGQERPSAYQKDDIWVLFSDPACQLATGGAGSRGSLQQGWVLLARSSWHGPNKDGR